MHTLTFLSCIALFFVFYIDIGHALKCYSCNSYANETCATLDKTDPSAAIFLQTCSLNATSCRKVEQTLTYDGKEHIRFYRQCATRSGLKKCVEKSGTIGVKMLYCHCDGDGCNSAIGISSSMTDVTILMSILGAIRHFIL